MCLFFLSKRGKEEVKYTLLQEVGITREEIQKRDAQITDDTRLSTKSPTWN